MQTKQIECTAILFDLDGAEYTLLRIAYLLPAASMQVGIMCAAPDGTGFPVTFEGLRIEGL
jgi:hypothetical protein